MQQTYREKTTVSKHGNLSIKGSPFKPGKSVEVIVLRKQKRQTSKQVSIAMKVVIL